MFTIEKTFTGDLAHRIHTQRLDSDFTEKGTKILKCRRLHGHTFGLKVKLGSKTLENDMVLDYNELGFVKDMINDILDHRTLIAESDPILEKVLLPVFSDYIKESLLEKSSEPYPIFIKTPWECSKFNIDVIEDQDIKEFLDSFVIVPFTTSSENISRWIFQIVESKIYKFNQIHSTDVKVLSVSYKETPNSEAVYS